MVSHLRILKRLTFKDIIQIRIIPANPGNGTTPKIKRKRERSPELVLGKARKAEVRLA
jgi:hypothetical protein